MSIIENTKNFLSNFSAKFENDNVGNISISEKESLTIDRMYKPNEEIFSSVADQFIENGWSIFPQESNDGRRPGSVNGEMIKWSEKHKLSTQKPTKDALELWKKHCGRLNVAVVLGPASGNAFVLDIDITEVELSLIVQEIAIRIFGDTPLKRVGREPKTAFVYRHSSEDVIQNTSPKFAAYDDNGGVKASDQGVEIIGSGKALTFWGRHYKTGRYFRWVGGRTPLDTSPEDLPLVNSEQVEQFFLEVDSVRRFHRSLSIESDLITTWEWDESTGIHKPKIKKAGNASNWVEDENGKVIDGREAYMTHIAFRVVTANKNAALDSTGKGPVQLAMVVAEQFMQTAELSGKWNDNRIRKEATTKVKHAIERAKSEKIHFWTPERDVNGKYINNLDSFNYIPEQPREKDDSLLFLPEFVKKNDVNQKILRKPFRCSIKMSEDLEIVEKIKLQSDRSDIATMVQEELVKSFSDFWNDVYERKDIESRIHIVKAPTGAGKTTRCISYIAEDKRTKDNYEIKILDGSITNADYPKAPILFLLPTYANIEELRNRATNLNLDGSLNDEELKKQAMEMGLIQEDDLEIRLDDLRRDAKNAGLNTMIYRGKIAAGCIFNEKLKLAMSAGIGTSGFCKSDNPEYTKEKQDLRNKMTKNGKSETEIRSALENFDLNTKIDKEIECVHYNSCPAIQQKKEINNSDVIFMPHAFLSLQIPEELKFVRAVVADERIHHLFLHTTVFDLNAFAWPRKLPKLTKKEKESGVNAAELEIDRSEISKIIIKSLLTNEDPVEKLLENTDFDKNDCVPVVKRQIESAMRMCGATIKKDANITPLTTIEEINDICQQPTGKMAREEYRFWKIIEERYDQRYQEKLQENLAKSAGMALPLRKTKGERDYRIQLLVDEKNGEINYLVRISWRELPNWSDRPLLLLDASAAPDMISKIWLGKEVVVHNIEAPLNIKTVVVADRTYSNSSLVPSPNSTQQEKILASKMLIKIKKALSTISGLYGWGRVVAGSSILVRKALNLNWNGPSNVDWCHYGAMRGLDFAKNHAAALSIGRMELPVQIIDGLVAALTYDDDEPEKPFDIYGTGKTITGSTLRIPVGIQNVQMRSGHVIELPTPMFPGKWGRMIQKQYREEELLQFLGRLRPVYRENEAPVWFSLTSVIPDGVIVDDIINIEDIITCGVFNNRKTTHIWDCLRKLDGIIDEDLIMKVCFDVYPNKKIAKMEIKSIDLDIETGFITGRRGIGFTSYKVLLDDGVEKYVFIRSDIKNPKELIEKKYKDILSINLKKIEEYQIGKKQMISRIRHPDSIELELGTQEERAKAEIDLTNNIAMQVLINTDEDAFKRFKDVKEPPLPIMIPSGLVDNKNEDIMVSIDELLMKESIDSLWKNILNKNVSIINEVDLNQITDKLQKEDNYESAGNHILDDQKESVENFDNIIPW